MKEYVYYISDNKMFRLSTSSGRSEEIKSQLLESYKDKIRENARRNEWKNNGSGAIFMGEVDPSDSPEVAARNVNSHISAIYEDGDELLYSMSIDSISGIYTHSDHTDKDGIVFSRNEYDYTHFDINGKRIVLSEGCGVETHIGILEKGTTRCEILTEGESRECWPTWSRMKNDRLIYSGCGLALTHDKGARDSQQMPYLGMPMRAAVTECVEGPYSVCSLDLETMELSEMIEDRSQKYSYIKPFEASDGYIYYIKKPYREKHEKKGGCLDALLAPFRLIAALFGFLNFFSMKYSGKTLTKNNGSSKAKQRSEAQMFIDGNLINAGEEMERNQKSGDKFPGVIPRSYELCRRLGPSGDEEVIKKGIIAYAVDTNGDVICSNGNHLLKLTPAGGKYEEALLTKEKAISFISI